MHNVVLSPIDPEKLITDISERVTVNILNAVKNNNPTTEQLEQLLTIQGAAALLHLSVPTLYSKHSKGEIPGVCKRGKRLYFNKQILIEWIKEGSTKSNAKIEQEAQEYFVNRKKGANHGK